MELRKELIAYHRNLIINEGYADLLQDVEKMVDSYLAIDSCALDETQAVRQNEDAEDVCLSCNGTGQYYAGILLGYKPCFCQEE